MNIGLIIVLIIILFFFARVMILPFVLALLLIYAIGDTRTGRGEELYDLNNVEAVAMY